MQLETWVAHVMCRDPRITECMAEMLIEPHHEPLPKGYEDDEDIE